MAPGENECDTPALEDPDLGVLLTFGKVNTIEVLRMNEELTFSEFMGPHTDWC